MKSNLALLFKAILLHGASLIGSAALVGAITLYFTTHEAVYFNVWSLPISFWVILIINTLLVWSISAFFTACTGWLIHGWWSLSLIMILCGAAAIYKFDTIDEMLTLRDFEAGSSIKGWYQSNYFLVSLPDSLYTEYYLIWGIFIAGIIGVVITKTQRKRMSYMVRWIYAGHAAIIFLTGSFFVPNENHLGPNILSGYFNWVEWSDRYLCLNYSYPMCLLMSGTYHSNAFNASEFKVKAAHDLIQSQSPVVDDASKAAKKVIIYIIESFWDPTELPVHFNVDPIPNFRRYAAQGRSGKLVQSVFGGKSMHTQFELLTGIPLAYLPENINPTTDYVNRSLPSLARVMKEKKYDSLVINSIDASLWNAGAFYRNQEFDKVILRPAFRNTVLYRNWRISDEYMVDSALNALETQNKQFLVVATEASHAPYDVQEGDSNRYWVSSGADSNTLDELNTFATQIHHADVAFGRFMDELAKRGDKSVVLAFGDHAPPFAYIWQSFHWLPANSMQEKIQLHKVPVLLWISTHETTISKEPIMLSPYAVAPVLLHAANISPDGYFSMVEQLSHVTPILIPGISAKTQTEQVVEFSRFAPRINIYEPIINDFSIIVDVIMSGKWQEIKQ